MSELDEDTALAPLGGAAGAFRARISDRWSIGSAPNGGYLAVITTRAIAKIVAQPDPFSVTTHFLAVARPGEAEVRTEIVRAGRGHSVAEARLIQDGREMIRTIANFGDLGAIDGATHITVPPPDLPPPDRCERGRPAPSAPRIADRLEVYLAPGTTSWISGAHNEIAELGGWIRLRDGRDPDPISLVFFADAFPPPVLNLAKVRTPWVPTIELTVHVRARPAPGFLRAWFRTRALARGYLEEDGELWDSAGALVAMSRQLARIQRA